MNVPEYVKKKRALDALCLCAGLLCKLVVMGKDYGIKIPKSTILNTTVGELHWRLAFKSLTLVAYQ